MKKMNNTVFKVWKTIKFCKAFGKEEEEEVQRDSEINQQKFVVKRIVKNILEMQIKVLLLQTLHVWSTEPLEEL